MHSVSKLYDKKGQLEWEAFNAGNDVLCFAENVAEGIQKILKNATPERIETSYIRIQKSKNKVGILSDNHSPTGSFDINKTIYLNREIAKNCITKIKGNKNNSIVFEAKKNNKLAKLSIYKNTDNAFFKTLSTKLSSPEYKLLFDDSIVDIEEKLVNYETLIIALFVPKAKPLENFGIEDSVLKILDRLFESKKCVIYVFGNPYVLQIIPKIQLAAGIIQVYQDFIEFQEVAANQLIEISDLHGVLPVNIDAV